MKHWKVLERIGHEKVNRESRLFERPSAKNTPAPRLIRKWRARRRRRSGAPDSIDRSKREKQKRSAHILNSTEKVNST